MNEEQLKRWKETRVFPVELWRHDEDSTPLVCPLLDRAKLRSVIEAVPGHLVASGWYVNRRPSFGARSVYADNHRGMGRQHIMSFPAGGKYFEGLAEYVAAMSPRIAMQLVDRLDELEAFVDRLLNQEQLGFAVTAEMRDEARRLMRLASAETGAAA